MTQAKIVEWLGYWMNANMVAVEEIQAFEHVVLARKFCECMRVGVFRPELVTDLSIWNAIKVMRAA